MLTNWPHDVTTPDDLGCLLTGHGTKLLPTLKEAYIGQNLNCPFALDLLCQMKIPVLT